jgi:hypothetical protein
MENQNRRKNTGGYGTTVSLYHSVSRKRIFTRDMPDKLFLRDGAKPLYIGNQEMSDKSRNR